MKAGNGLNLELGEYQKQIGICIRQLEDQDFVQRLWNKDETLWEEEQLVGAAPALSMGWMRVAGKMLEALPMMDRFYRMVLHSGFDHVVLLGMGGSSLAASVYQKTFERSAEGLRLTVLDSTDPGTIHEVESKINISTTMFIVSSKSGTTAEVMALYSYFYERVHDLKGERANENFVAITDDGSPLAELACRKRFRKLFINFPDIGGRYSALSYFGIVPAVLMGIDVKGLLERTLTMEAACGPQVPLADNPGVLLGIALAELALHGRDKLTYLISSEFSSFGLWLEQLIAESTGKNGKGILPVNGSPLTEPEWYGKDRFFFQFNLASHQDKVQTLEVMAMGHPLINIQVENALDLGREFLRWEIATATAGILLGVNPFDQPDVEESKKCTNKVIKRLTEEGVLPVTEPTLEEGSLRFYWEHHAKSGKLLLEDFLASVKPGDYITVQAYLHEEGETENCLEEIRDSLQENLHLPVSCQFGPRYLHSTGQYHKGGPDTGFFIQLVSGTYEDILIPERGYTFGMLKRAQAMGDREALVKKGRRVLMIDLGDDVMYGLYTLKEILEIAVRETKPVETEAYSFADRVEKAIGSQVLRS